MRILHTSDWHLGKRLFKLDRSSEHQLFLDWLIEVLQTREIDFLIIAGDVFDTPTPPHQSLTQFYEFLHRVSTETNCETLIIAGNHDSGMLLEAPSKILNTHRVKVWGKLSPDPDHHWIQIKAGNEKLDVCAIPFFRSHELMPQGDGDAISALRKYLGKPKAAPQLLILHHLAGMYEAAGSEQVISLSGVDSIPAALLETFDYVALGHIHKPQRISDKCYYSGSPIPLRFSETIQKSVIIIEQTNNTLTPALLPIPLFRSLITIKSDEKTWRKKIIELAAPSGLTPMVEMQLTLDSPKMGLIDEIKSCLEDKEMELLSFLPFYATEEKKEHRGNKLFDLTTTDLFKEFYKSKYPHAPEIPEELMSDFNNLLEKAKNAPPKT